MKKVVLIIALLTWIGTFGQLTNTNNTTNTSNINTGVFGSPTNSLGLQGAEEGTITVNPIDIWKIEGFGSARDFDDIRFGSVPTDGSVLLFDEWENRGVIEVEDKRYIFNNMNFHMVKSTFMSKIDNDSVVSFDLSTFNRIVINDLVFKSIYNPARRANETFQVIYESQAFSILKTYEIVIREADPNPMTNRSKRKIQKKANYHLKKGNSIKPFKLRKKSILQLAGDKSGELEKYAKENRLSFNKDEDVTRLLTIIMNRQG